MNSSGIKRGLAATAVSALAIAGIPLLASSASAEPGDEIVLGSVGPTLNGGTTGGVVVLKTKNISEAQAEGDPGAANTAAFQLSNTNLNGSPTNANQAVSLVGVPVWVESGTANDSNKTDGYDEVTLRVAVTTSDPGAAAAYAIYMDDATTGGDDQTVQASEARVQVSQTTSGALASVEIAPASQTVAAGNTSGDYTVTLKDSAGRTTQLQGTPAETIGISTDHASIDTNDADDTISAAEAPLGTFKFKATTTGATPTGAHTITLDPSRAGVPNATASLTVGAAASLTDAMVDIVTAADSWNGFGNNPDVDGDNTQTLVRVDQGSIKIDIKGGAGNAGATVTLNLDGHAGPNQITFGGQATSTVSTVLDAQGNGSITITPDTGTVQENEEIAVSGSGFTEDLVFQRAAGSAVVIGQDIYFSALKATTTVTGTVVDQFGNPITTGFVSAFRDAVAPNAETPPGQIKPVGADGTVSFDFTDTNAAVGQSDTVTLAWVPDQFTPIGQAKTDTATIKYTATGQGADFNTFLDTKNTGVPTYKASDVTVAPLASDGVADTDATEFVAIELLDGEAGQAVTLSVDNGALIVDATAGGDTVAEGKSSVTVNTDGGGDILTAEGLRIIGTKSGVTTLTITSANRTETAQFTVSAQTDTTTARNVAVEGEDTVESGTTQVPFTVTVTDAFGNGVPNVAVSSLNIQVTGPGQFQDSSGVTNAAGELTVNVRADADAEGEVGITVTGLPNAVTNQFGAGANQLDSAAAANSAPGFTVSANQASATTVIEAAEPEPVDPKLVVSGKGGKTDKVKANAIADAAGAKATLWVGGVKKKTGTLNESGNFTFSIKDKNGKKATKYVVKISATDLTTADKASAKIK
ncbi:hypothetical protein [Nocardioides caricicola]|uniref:Beta strand repeat-containing protein n=1 Tax=Nocardioides caricicola TaxID=634770 RepID=A0ABW0N7C3_9ACTN